MISQELVAMIEAELTEVGFEPLKKKEEVNQHFKNHTDTTLLVINSMCGCAGPDARSGVIEALAQSTHKPNNLVTIFPSDQEAMEEVQNYIKPYPLSSPAIALIRNGEVVHFMERHQIKGQDPEVIADELVNALIAYC